MKKKRPGPKLPVAQFIAIIALSISIFLIVDLARRAAANYRVQREAYRLTLEVEAMREHQAKLLARRSYVASDLYVEEVARSELKWAKPGEMVIVVMPTPAAITSQPTPANVAAASQQPAKTPAEAWWLLFFGERAVSPLPATADSEAGGPVSVNVE